MVKDVCASAQFMDRATADFTVHFLTRCQSLCEKWTVKETAVDDWPVLYNLFIFFYLGPNFLFIIIFLLLMGPRLKRKKRL
jgi:hypothetical protein